MSKGIDIAIAADTKSAQSAIQRGLISPLEDVSEQLELLGDDSTDATRDLEKGMRNAQRRTEDAKDEIRDLRDELNKTGRAGKTAGADIEDGFDKAKEGADDFKQEADGTAREVAASFDGSAESIAGGFQELAANAFAGFGPAGALAGLAAAAGIGLATAGFQEMQEDAEATEQRVRDMYDDMLESGSNYLSAKYVTEGIAGIFGDPKKYDEASQLAKNLGADIDNVARALAGDRGAATRLIDDQNTKLQEQIDWINKGNYSESEKGIRIRDTTNDYHRQIDKINGIIGAEDSAASRADSARSAQSDFWHGVIKDAGEATKEVDEFGNELYTLPDGEQVLVKAETGQATSNLDTFKGDVDGIPETVTTKVKVEVDDTKWRNWVPVTKNGRVEAYINRDGGGRTVI
jgi:hypothetical protein